MDDPWPFALAKARIGSMVQRRPFIGVQGAPMYPSHMGFVVSVEPLENQAGSVEEYQYEVVFILRDGNLKRSTHFEEDLILINI